MNPRIDRRVPAKTCQLIDIHAGVKSIPSHRDVLVDLVTDIDRRVEAGTPVGVLTGLRSLDELVGGFQPGHLIVLAGRTSMGKTAAAITIALNVLRGGLGVGIVSCEMSHEELSERMISQLAHVGLVAIKRGYLSRRARIAVHEAADELDDLPIQVCDHVRAWPQVEAELRRMAATGAGLLLLDYLGLVHVPGKQPRWDQIRGVTAGLKGLASELCIPIMALCQINRDGAREKEKRPDLVHLRDSGSVEQDADVAIMLHRPGQYDPAADQESCEAIVRKNRHGPIGAVKLRWHAETASVHDDSEQDEFDAA